MLSGARGWRVSPGAHPEGLEASHLAAEEDTPPSLGLRPLPEGPGAQSPPRPRSPEGSALSTRVPGEGSAVPGRERSSCSLGPSGHHQPAQLGAGRLFRVKKMFFVPSAAHAPSGSSSLGILCWLCAASRQWDLSCRVSGGVPVSVGFTVHQLPSQRNGQFSRNVCLS